MAACFTPSVRSSRCCRGARRRQHGEPDRHQRPAGDRGRRRPSPHRRRERRRHSHAAARRRGQGLHGERDLDVGAAALFRAVRASTRDETKAALLATADDIGRENPGLDRNSFGMGYLRDDWLLAAVEIPDPYRPRTMTPFGKGCPGSNRLVPALDRAGTPDLGKPHDLILRKAPPRAPFAFLAGTTNTYRGSLFLPYDLAPIGARGCRLLVSTDVLRGSATDRHGEGRLRFAVPAVEALRHGRVSHQGLVVDPRANHLGAVLTRALRAIHGGRR